MNLQQQEGGAANGRFEERKGEYEDWLNNPHIQRIILRFPNMRESIQRVLDSEVLSSALHRASAYSDAQLAEALEADLRAAFPGLEGGTPRTVQDLDFRDAAQGDPAAVRRSDDEIRKNLLEQRTGGSADYLAQRMTAAAAFLDFGKSISHFVGLEESLRHELDRVATLFVAFQRADRSAKEDSDVAVAK